MVLAHLMLESNHNIALAHCNYKLRGHEADKDQDLVMSWGKSKGIDVYQQTFDLKQVTGSIQLKARNLRYAWFNTLLKQEGFNYVLTAHHADDDMETFFINLARGTGLDGLTGIPGGKGLIVRPLLPYSKAEIISYAKANSISWREDASNQELKYARNQIRHTVIPALHEINPGFSQNFKKTQHYLAQSAEVLQHYGKALRGQLFKKIDGDCHIKIKDLTTLYPLEGHLYLLFHEYGFTQWEDLKNLLDGQSGKEVCSKTHRIIKDREHIILTEIFSDEDGTFVIAEGLSKVEAPFELRIESVEKMGKPLDNEIYLDKEKLNYPLKLRKWKIGDYFYPLGMSGRKKLSKFFKDEKLNSLEKERQWLLCSGDDVVWVLGKRLDDRFKVKEETKAILKITWIS